MITELILTPFIFIAKLIIGLLPDFVVNFPESVMHGITVLSQNVGYVLPIPGLIKIFNLYLLFLVFRFGFSLVIRIKSFIPSMGN
ncbi:hypothetical protein Osc1_18470 [Hominimerdicola sp. 21CYCFAH17_S]